MTLWSNQALHVITDSLAEEEQNHSIAYDTNADSANSTVRNVSNNSDITQTALQSSGTTTAVAHSTLQQHHHSNSTSNANVTRRHRSDRNCNNNSNSTQKQPSTSLFRRNRNSSRPQGTVSLNGTSTNIALSHRVSVDVAGDDTAEHTDIHVVNTGDSISDSSISDVTPTLEVMPTYASTMTNTTAVYTPKPSWLDKFKQYFTTAGSTTTTNSTVPATSVPSADSTTIAIVIEAADATSVDDVTAIAESIAGKTDASTRNAVDTSDNFDEMYDSEYDEQQHSNQHDVHATTHDGVNRGTQESSSSSNGKHANDIAQSLPIHMQLTKTASRTARLHKVCGRNQIHRTLCDCASRRLTYKPQKLLAQL
jgi:hypothetical protein